MMLERLEDLWRERWAIAGPIGPERARARLSFGPMAPRLTGARAWNFAGLSLVSLLVALLILWLVASLQLTVAGQVGFASILFLAALYVDRHTGFLATLMVLVLAIVASARYFFWRYGASLPPVQNMGYWVGWLVVTAELLLSGWMALRLLNAAWPLKYQVQQLPASRRQWPMLDFCFRIGDASIAQIEAGINAVFALQWPTEKTHVILCDASERADVQELARRWGCAYVVCGGDFEDALGRVAAIGQGELIVAFDQHGVIDSSSLEHIAAWMYHDANLAMAHTPEYPAAPRLHKGLMAQFGKDWEPAGGFAVLRRAVMERGVGPAANASATLGERLIEQGLKVACVAPGEAHATGRALQGHGSVPWVRIDHVGWDRSGRFRRFLSRTQSALAAVVPLAALTVALVPILELMAGLVLIQATLPALAAYLVPHLAHGYLAVRRVRMTPHRALWRDLSNKLGRVYLGLASAGLAARLVLLSGMNRLPAEQVRALGPREGEHLYGPLVGVWISANLAAMCAGLWLLESAPRDDTALLWLFTLGAAGLAIHGFTVLSRLWETRFRRWSDEQHSALAVMIKLARGRTLACATRNFPSRELELVLPTRLAVARGEKIRMALQPESVDVELVAIAQGSDSEILPVQIDSRYLRRYFNLLRQLRQPPSSWPAWLPGPALLDWFPGVVSRIRQRAGFGAGLRAAPDNGLAATSQRQSSWTNKK